MQDVVVIGAGLAGLSAGVALADAGLRVTVLEAAERLGGRASSWTDQATGDVVDIGPHVVHTEYCNMLAFLERLGTRHLISWQPDPVLTIASRPHATPLRHARLPCPLSLFPSLLRAPGLRARDYASMTGCTFRAMQFGEERVPALDRLTALDYFRSLGVTEPMIDWWWRFAAMVGTNVPLERCSAAALLRIHAQLSGHRQVQFGFGAVGLAELYAAPSVQAIEAADGRVLLRTAAKALRQHDGGSAAPAGVTAPMRGTADAVPPTCGARPASGRGSWQVLLADGAALTARHVVCAVPPHTLDRLLPAQGRRVPPFDQLDTFEPSPYISVYLWFDRRITDVRFFAHLYSPQRLNYDFYDLAQIRQGWQDRPSVIASNIIYSHRAHGMSDDEIVRATVADIAEFAPEAAQARVTHAQVHRIPMAIPCPLPNTEAKRAPTHGPLPGLMIAGDWTDTHLPCSMESAVRSGYLAAEAILHDRGTPRELAALAIPQRPTDGLAGLGRRATLLMEGRRDGRYKS